MGLGPLQVFDSIILLIYFNKYQIGVPEKSTHQNISFIINHIQPPQPHAGLGTLTG